MARINEYIGALASEAAYYDLKKGQSILLDAQGVVVTSNEVVKFTVLDFYSDTIPGLQMALLQDVKTGEKIVSFRGTKGIADIITDVIMGITGYIPGVIAKQFEVAQGIFNAWKLVHGLDKNDTTIVGHSLGGSLAQFFGASTEFDTLTYNAFGMDNEIPDAAYNNIHNYKTVMDPLSSLSIGMDNMIGITHEVGDKSYSDKLAHGLSNFFKNGGSIWTTGNEIIGGSDFTDTIYGNKGNDIIHGDSGDDNDTFTDYLQGGEGKDIYISGDSDHIKDDTTGEGRVYFEGKLLTGGTKEAGAGCGTGPNGSDEYYGDGGVYRLSGTTLTFTKDKKILTINDYIKNDLSITLKDNKADNGACPSSAPNAPCPKPTNPLFRFNFSLPSVTRTVINYLSGGGGGTPPIVLDLNRNGITSINRTQFISKHKELAA